MKRSAAYCFAVITAVLIVAAAAFAASVIDQLSPAHLFGEVIAAVFCGLAAIALPMWCILFARLPVEAECARGPLTGTEQIVAVVIVFAFILGFMATQN